MFFIWRYVHPTACCNLFYGRQGWRKVSVPKGLDNKIWYLPPSVASATRMITKAGPHCRYQSVALTRDLKLGRAG